MLCPALIDGVVRSNCVCEKSRKMTWEAKNLRISQLFWRCFQKNEFLYYLIFRLSGGAGIPFVLQNSLPLLFDMKVKNYFYSSLLGLVPGLFILNSLGSGIEKLIQVNKNLTFMFMFVWCSLRSDLYNSPNNCDFTMRV